MVKILVKKINYKNKDLPKYETVGSSGLDLIANIDNNIILKPNAPKESRSKKQY